MSDTPANKIEAFGDPSKDPRVVTFLRRAIELSEQGMSDGFGGPFGAVVVKADRIVGEGFNRVLHDNDPTAHAEVVAIRHACAHLNTFDLSGCEVFASSQPCPMCLAAIYWARASKVYFANTIADAATIGFDDSFFYDELRLPLGGRTLPQIHVVVPEAIKAFNLWGAMANRRAY
ncbi:MAG TPA: nucleoside deaminase [Tepidisphaeraceae bacterium]|nr:nucleoside deaminase [Tepidisphaeraceae bacterium]